jgi:hypothetical protein
VWFVSLLHLSPLPLTAGNPSRRIFAGSAKDLFFFDFNLSEKLSVNLRDLFVNLKLGL